MAHLAVSARKTDGPARACGIRPTWHKACSIDTGGSRTSDQLMRRYEFSDFADWAGTVNASIEDFTQSVGIHANIMCGCSSVWRAINEAVRDDVQNVVNAEGEHPGPDDVVELAGFCYGDECHPTFTVNEVIFYPGFLLVFDEETILAAVPYAL